MISWALPDAVRASKHSEYQGTALLLYQNDKLKESPLRHYVLFTGLWQSWDMFAPNPANTDIYLTAEVVYKDHTMLMFQYPRMKLLPVGQKYYSERYRKFFERANQDKNRSMWPGVARAIAIRCNSNPDNPPVEVTLIRHYKTVQRPDAQQWPSYKTARFYTYQVTEVLPKL